MAPHGNFSTLRMVSIKSTRRRNFLKPPDKGLPDNETIPSYPMFFLNKGGVYRGHEMWHQPKQSAFFREITQICHTVVSSNWFPSKTGTLQQTNMAMEIHLFQ